MLTWHSALAQSHGATPVRDALLVGCSPARQGGGEMPHGQTALGDSAAASLCPAAPASDGPSLCENVSCCSGTATGHCEASVVSVPAPGSGGILANGENLWIARAMAADNAQGGGESDYTIEPHGVMEFATASASCAALVVLGCSVPTQNCCTRLSCPVAAPQTFCAVRGTHTTA